MAWTVTPTMLVMLGSGLIAVTVGVLALRRYPDQVAGALAVMMFAVAMWAIPDAISLGYTDLDMVLFWQRLTYPGALLAPVAYLVVGLAYAGHDRWLSRRVYAALLLIPVLTVPVVWASPGPGLFWRSPELMETAAGSVLDFERGPWNWIHLGYGYLVTAAGLLLFGSVVVRSGPVYRKQSALLFVGGVVPLAVNVGANVLITPAVDLTTVALAVTGITFALALFYLDLLEVRPVARNRLVEELDDGVVVIGPEGRIRDFNPTAERLFEELAVDAPANDVLPEEAVPDGGELAVEMGGRERLFRTRSTTLSDDRDRESGRIIYFNDVTEIVEREQRISVLNRVLRHNIRNELNVAAGHLATLSGRVPEGDREHVETAAASVDRVTTLADKARDLERTLRDTDPDQVVSLTPVVERVVSDATERFDRAAIAYEPPENDAAAEVRVVDRSFLETALSELIENGVLHNGRDQPEVTVAVDPGPEEIHVRVVDDGPGIPEAERRPLRTRGETDLDHASGLGLWLVKWTASLSAGDIAFGDRDPRGSVVTLSLPAA